MVLQLRTPAPHDFRLFTFQLEYVIEKSKIFTKSSLLRKKRNGMYESIGLNQGTLQNDNIILIDIGNKSKADAYLYNLNVHPTPPTPISLLTITVPKH